MNINFKGTVSGIDPTYSDSISEIKIATRILGETADAAVSAGRVISLTDGTKITNFQNSGVGDTEAVAALTTRVIGWHTISVNVTGDSSAYIKIDGNTLYTGILPIATAQVLRLFVTNSWATTSTTPGRGFYLANARRNGAAIAVSGGSATPIQSMVAGAGGWTHPIATGATTTSQTIAGVACSKLAQSGAAAGQESWELLQSSALTGLYEIDVYDTGDTDISFRFIVYDVSAKTNFITIDLRDASSTQENFSGWRIGGTSYTGDVILPFVNKITPSVKVTKQRSGVYYSGGWTDGADIFGVLAPSVGFATCTGTSTGVSMSWVLPQWGGVTGFKIYRALESAPTTWTLLTTTNSTTTTYTDTTAADSTTYLYKIHSTNSISESLGYIPRLAMKGWRFYENFNYADGSLPNGVTYKRQVYSALGGTIYTGAPALPNNKVDISGGCARVYMGLSASSYAQCVFEVGGLVTYANFGAVEVKIASGFVTSGVDNLFIGMSDTLNTCNCGLYLYCTGVGTANCYVQKTNGTQTLISGLTAAHGDTFRVTFPSTSTMVVYKNGTATGTTYTIAAGAEVYIPTAAATLYPRVTVISNRFDSTYTNMTLDNMGVRVA